MKRLLHKNYEDALAMQKAQHETGKVLNIGVVNHFNNGSGEDEMFIDFIGTKAGIRLTYIEDL